MCRYKTVNIFIFFKLREREKELTARKTTKAQVPEPAAAVLAELEAALVKGGTWRQLHCLRWLPWAEMQCR